MNRILILAAAAALCAGSAGAQQPSNGIRVATAGKTPEQIRSDVFKAAKRVCSVEIVGASFPVDEMRACVDATVRNTLAQAPELKLAQR